MLILASLVRTRLMILSYQVQRVYEISSGKFSLSFFPFVSSQSIQR